MWRRQLLPSVLGTRTHRPREEADMTAPLVRNLDQPDEIRDFPRGAGATGARA